MQGRQAILAVHSKNKPLSKEISLETLAKRTPGFSGADLENLLNEAALLAARKNKSVIEMTDCEEAIDRVMVGPGAQVARDVAKREREHRLSRVRPRDRWRAARERRPGPQGDDHPARDGARHHVVAPRRRPPFANKKELLANITMALAGRISEEIKFGDVTTGASNDFEKATELARRMVTQYGMSDTLGPIQYGRGSHQVFLGRDFGEERNYSEEVASKIDVRGPQDHRDCYAHGKRMLMENWDKVERMVASLLEHETVETEEVAAILTDRPYDRVREAEVAATPDGPSERSATDEAKRAEKPTRFPPKISPEPA